ncbi:MAG: ABC transporter ATP-binding protein, partial [Chloroflexi bacterium]|nr:ABC transporter ATP-binding protein [Chloroflexota bacterium]
MQPQDKNTLMSLDLQSAVSESRLQGVWRLLQGYRLHYAGALTTLALSSVLNTSKFLLLRYLVDDVLIGEVDNLGLTLVLIALGFVILALFQGLFTFMSGRLAAVTAEGVTQRVRNYLYDHLQRLTFTYHDTNRTGELIQRSTSDVDAIHMLFAEQAIGSGRILLLFVVNFAAILLLDWQLALLSVVVIPFVVVVSYFFFKRVSAAYEEVQDQEAKVSTVLQENLSGVRVVKAFARQQYEENKFEQENAEQFRLGKRLLTLHSLYWPISDSVTGLQMLVGFAIGALFAIDGRITVGTYLAYAGLVIWIIFPIREIGRLIVQMSTGLVSFDRVLEVIRESREPLGEDVPAPTSELRGDITFAEVSFAYNPQTPVLHDISFSAQAGQTVALLGATGSGKTTLMSLIPRFYEYSVGSIKLDGVELHAYPRSFLRHNIGIVEQQPFLFSRSIRENIAYGVGRPVSDEEIERVAKAAA